VPRILHVGKFFPPVPGGIETYLADLLDASLDAGLDVAALVHQPHRSPSSGPARNNRFPLYTVPSYGQLLYAPVSPGFPLALHRAIRSFRPDVLHLHLPNPSAFAALALPCAGRVPWVVHWHADVDGTALSPLVHWAYRLYRPLEQAVLRRSARVIVTSPDYLAGSRALSAWHNRCRIVPLGVSPTRLRDIGPAQRDQAGHAWPQRSGLRVLAAGRLTYYKGFEVLVQAIAKAEPSVTLVIVGEGPSRTKLEEQIRGLKQEHRIRLLGYREDSELQGLMAACDVLCLPSIDRSEAFGLVLLEAMHYGRPVIASDIPGSGVGWVVRQGGHGLLVPPGEADALADALNRFQAQPDLRKHFSQIATQRFAGTFGLTASVEQLALLYQGVCA